MSSKAPRQLIVHRRLAMLLKVRKLLARAAVTIHASAKEVLDTKWNKGDDRLSALYVAANVLPLPVSPRAIAVDNAKP